MSVYNYDKVIEWVSPRLDEGHEILIMVPINRFVWGFMDRYPQEFAKLSLKVVASTAQRWEIIGLMFDTLLVVGADHPQISWDSVKAARKCLIRYREHSYWEMPLGSLSC